MNIYIINRGFRAAVTRAIDFTETVIDIPRGTLLTEGQYNTVTGTCSLVGFIAFNLPLEIICELNRFIRINTYTEQFDLYDDLEDTRRYSFSEVCHYKVNTSLLEYYDTRRSSVLRFRKKAIKNDLGEKYADYFKYTPIKINSKAGFYISGYIVRQVNHLEDIAKKSLTYDYLIPTFNKKEWFHTEAITKDCKFLVKDYGNSSKLFKFTQLKKSLVGKTLLGTEIELEAKVKNSEEVHQTIKLILEDGRKSRFLLSDVEIIYPNLASFNPPKDRELKIGATARLVDNRKTGIPKHSSVKVIDIKKVGNKKYAIVDHKGQKVYTNYKSLKVC